MEENQLAVAAPQDFSISIARDPKVVIAEAYNAARALKDIIEAKPADKKVVMGGEQYIEFEDWQLLGKFYGLTAKVSSTEYVELGGARGFNARASVFHAQTGQEISAAESLCLNDEEKWSSRPKYEWKDEVDANGNKIWIEGSAGKKGHYKGKRVQVGEVAVPLFQLKSMAQTRACAKALRNVLSGVVVLAGYKATVFEEMTGDEPEVQALNRPPIQQPTPKAAETPKQASTPNPDLTYETIVVQDVTVETKPKKNGQGTWDCYTIHAASGWKGNCFSEVGQQSQKLLGQTAKVGYKSTRWGNSVESIALETAPVGA